MPEIRSLTDLAEYAQDQLDRIARMQRELADYAGEGESPRRLVHARTGPGGGLLDLRLDPDVLQLSTDGATQEITAAIVAAQRDYATRADEIMAPILAARPSEESTAAIEQGVQRLDALTADLERLAHRHGLSD
jgi:DNA-binding protein YbaB